MMWINNRIPATALLLLIPMTIVEPPGSTISAAGDGGFLSFVIGFGLATLGAVTAGLLARRHPEETLAGSLRTLFGRPLGTVLAAGYALFWLATAAWLLRFEAAETTDLLLPLTPVAVPMLCMLALAVYLTAHGVEPMARWCFVVLPFGLAVALLFSLIGIARGEPVRLADLPAGGLPEVVRKSLEVAGVLEGIAAPLMLSGYFLQPHRIPAATLGGMAIAGVALGSAVAMVLSMFGVRGASLYHWPAVATVQNVILPGFAVEKMDIIYLAGIGMLGLGRFALLYLMATVTIQNLIPSVPLRTVAFALAPPLLAMALLPPHFDSLSQIRALLVYPTWGFCYGIPLVGLGLSSWRSRRARADRGARALATDSRRPPS